MVLILIVNSFLADIPTWSLTYLVTADEGLNPFFLAVDAVARMEAMSRAKYFIFQNFLQAQVINTNATQHTMKKISKCYISGHQSKLLKKSMSNDQLFTFLR